VQATLVQGDEGLRISVWPRTTIGRLSVVLSASFVVLIVLKMSSGVPVTTPVIAGIGVAGFLSGIVAVSQRDRSIGTFFAILVGLLIAVVFTQIGVSSLGLLKDFPVKTVLSAAEAGHDGTLVMGLGRIAQSEGHIYYSYDGGLYRRNVDWTGKTRIADVDAGALAVIGDWIFYTRMADGSLYRMALDGTGTMRITEDAVESFAVSDATIVYRMKGANDGTVPGKDPSPVAALVVAGLDGSDRTQLVDVDLIAPAPVIVGDWIYYCADSDLRRIRCGGTEDTLVAEDVSIEYVSGDWIYYLIRSDEARGLETVTLCRLKLDGTEKSTITRLEGVYMTAFDSDWLYFTAGKGLSRIKLDGTGSQKLNNVSIWGLIGVAGDWFYIDDYGGPTWRVKLDGSVGTRIN